MISLLLVLCNKSSSVLSVACNFGPFDVSNLHQFTQNSSYLNIVCNVNTK